MDDVELVNAFFCGGPACEKLYIDRPFYRWEGTGFEQCDPVRDLCEACFTAYTETDKEDFKLYTRDKMPSETDRDVRLKKAEAEQEKKAYLAPFESAFADAANEMSMSESKAAGGDVCEKFLLTGKSARMQQAEKRLTKAREHANTKYAIFITLNRYRVPRPPMPEEGEEEEAEAAAEEGTEDDVDGKDQGSSSEADELDEAAETTEREGQTQHAATASPGEHVGLASNDRKMTLDEDEGEGQTEKKSKLE